jgi:hypothetical protein
MKLVSDWEFNYETIKWYVKYFWFAVKYK